MSAAAIAPLPVLPATAGQIALRASTPRPVELLAFQTAPMLCAACCFAMGILLSRLWYQPPPLALLSLLFAAIVTILAVRLTPRLSLTPLCLSWIAAGLFCAEIHPSPDPQAALLAAASGGPHALQGNIVRVGPVRAIESAAPFSGRTTIENSQLLDLRLRSLSGPDSTDQAISGGLRLALYAPGDRSFSAFQCGDELRLTASIHPPERYNDPGVWDSTAYLLGQGISALASAKTTAVTILSGPRHPSFACRLKALQQTAGERVMGLAAEPDPDAPSGPHLAAFFRLTTEDASMLAAMITGDRLWLQRRTRIGFERTGSFHLLVVSGLHLAIFAGLIFWLASRLRLTRLWASLFTIAAAFAYAVFTGYGQPVQRSFWMVTIYLLGRLIWRERSALNAIGLAALCLLAASPPSLFDAGFQMTLLSVIAIAGIAVPIAERTFAPYLCATQQLSLLAIDPALPQRVAQFRVSLRLLATHLNPLIGGRLARNGPATVIRFTLRIVELLLVSVVVEVVMSLPMALYFHRVTVFALPVNFLIVPFLGLLLPSALLTFSTLLISARLAAVPAACTAALLHSVIALIHAFANMRAGNLRISGPTGWSIMVFVLLLAFAIYAARMQRFAIPTCIVAFALMSASVLFPRAITHKAGALEVTAIDVGQGDSLLVVTPEGKTLLIDAGGSPFSPPPGVANFDIGEEVVSAYLWSRGIRRLDAVALTHAHADHIGGMPAVLANFRPREIWIGSNPHSPAYAAFLAEGQSVGAVVEHRVAGEHFPFGSADVEVLAPDASYRPSPSPANNDSLVLRLQYGNTSALLEGDAEAPSERRMTAEGHLHSDLLKIGHHGSRSSTTPPFLAAVSPSFAVISVGSRNLYGHPRREILDELQSGHIHTYRTDTIGLSTFYLDGHAVTAAPLPGRAD